MNLEEYYNYCLQKKGTTEHFPFDKNTLVFKIGEKMFALTSLTSWENNTPSINLKCDPENAEELRLTYHAISPGYHMNKKHWNTVAINQDANDEFIKALIDHSYNLIWNSLSKKTRDFILESESKM